MSFYNKVKELDAIAAAEDLFGIKLEGPLKDDPRPTGETAPSGRPQASFEREKKLAFQSVLEHLRKTQLSYIDQVPTLGLDTLQIHDILFAMPTDLTPPTSIRIDKDMVNYKWHTLRTSEVQKVTSGHSTARIYLSLYFVGLEAINNGLRRLLAVFNGLPFVYIENSFIRNNLVPAEKEQRNMACSLVSIAVRTEPQTPNVLVADLTLLWFNYKPFATDFHFRKSWNSVHDAPITTQTVYDQQIMSIAGGPAIPSEEDVSMAEPLPKNDFTAAFSPPAILPQNSEPLRKLVASREGETMKVMDNKIEIKYREYVSIGGLYSGTISAGKTNKELLREVSSADVSTGRRTLLQLHPRAGGAFEELAKSFRKQFSRPGKLRKLRVQSCYRTREMQRELQQTRPTLASKEYSWHEVGMAIDIATINIGMTRAEYKWLIDRAGLQGFRNLGTHEGYSPRFSDGGRWNDGGDPNATIIRPLATRDDKNHLTNWETWHFDFVPTQRKARTNHGNNTQNAIKTLRGMIHYTSVGLGAKEIVSETGEETSLDKVRQRDEQAEIEIGKRLDSYLRQEWKVDPLASDPVRILLYKSFVFTIEDRDTQLIPQGITFAKSNIIAEIPILSHEFSTQQYMGSTDLDATISFIAVKEGKLKALQAVVETIQKNARIAKGVRDAAVVDITNSVLNFGGMKQAMVEQISAMSIQGSPGLYQVNLTLTQARRKERQDLNQEKYIKMDAWKEATRWVIDNLFVMQPHVIKDLKYIAAWETLNELTHESKDNDADMRQDLGDYTQQDYDNLEPGTQGTDERMWLIKSLELLQRGIRRYVYHESNVQKSGSHSEKHSGFMIDYLREDDLYTTPIAEILREYASIVAMIVAEPFPKELLFRLGLEKLAPFIQDSYEQDAPQYSKSFAENQAKLIEDKVKGRLKKGDWSGAAEESQAVIISGDMEAVFEFTLKQYKSRLQRMWVRIYNEALYLHPVFGNLYTQMYKVFEQFRRGSECYPDLNLPAITEGGSALDTPPDYWFWNASVDGNMIFNHQETQEVAAQFMANAYESMKQFVTPEEWEKNYISPNKAKIRKRTTGSDGNPKTKLAALVSDEAGMGTLGKYKIPGEVIGQVFDELAGHTPPKLNGKVIQMGGNNEGAQIKPDESIESQPITDGYSGRIVDMLEKSLQNFDAEVYRMARAYPTFKVYFMEEDLTDSGRLGIRNFDDFYSYSAIKDIRVVRSRKIPADLCVISITNIHGELDTLAYGGNDESSSARVVEKFDPFTVNTDQENPFTKLVVLEGSKIQVRLGYSNDPNRLETVFTGQVVEVGVSPISPDIMQLVCQSYGTELVARTKTGGGYGSTGELLSSMICSEECFHFGHYERTSVYDPAEVRSGTEGDSRAGFLGFNQAADAVKESLLRKKNFRNKPQDDNVFAPEFGDYETWGHSLLDAAGVVGLGGNGPLAALGLVADDRIYHPWRTTIWDIFKEMELRHPGYVAMPVPYGNRYTLFFGHPSHKYWSRPLSEIERGGWGLVEGFLQDLQSYSKIQPQAAADFLRTQATGGLSNQGIKDLRTKIGSINKSMRLTDLHGRESNFGVAYAQFNKYLYWLAKGRVERYKPFREYHFLSSENNIIANNIKASAHGTFNAVELTYMGTNIKHKAVKSEQGAQREILRALDLDANQLKMKADDNIEEHQTRMMQALYTTCAEDYFARRYAVGLLLRSLRDVYKGTIMITGNPKIKPYDVCVLFDTYRDIYGPIEVEQVTHIMSQETGFVTEIKPDLILTHNAATTQCTMDAMVHATAKLYGDIADHIGDEGATDAAVITGAAGAAAVGSVGLLAGGVGFGLLALGGYKLVEWSQERQPIVITPLMNGIKPLIAGLDGYKRDSLWRSIEGRWKKFSDDMGEGWHDWWERNPMSSWWHENMSDWLNPGHE